MLETPLLYLQDGALVICQVCPRRCRLRRGQTGVCQVRANQDGRLALLTYGRVAAAYLDPVEKKPLLHFHPGSRVYTLALPGCTLRCRFCMNWELTQTLPAMRLGEIPLRTPAEVVESALQAGADGVGFSYSEPGAMLEYALEVMQLARQAGLYTAWHTNGYLTAEAARAAAAWLDAACVDFKLPSRRASRLLTGGLQLEDALRTARIFREHGVWVEACTPVLEGVNSDPTSIRQLARRIQQALGVEAPWHLLRGVPAWKMGDLPLTSLETLQAAARAAQAAGMQRVYIPL